MLRDFHHSIASGKAYDIFSISLSIYKQQFLSSLRGFHRFVAVDLKLFRHPYGTTIDI